MPYLGTVELKASDIRRIDITSSTSATHTLTWTAPNEQSLIVTINGVKQQNNYTVSGTTLTLDTALVATDELEVIGINDIGTTITPAQGSVDTDQLANVAVTTAKIADDAVTADKLADSINTEIAANTAKVTNATHTGDVTGATALTIAADAVDIAMLSATGTADATTFLRGDNAWASAGGNNDPVFQVYLSADQAISGATFTKIQFNTTDIDTATGWDGSTNYRYTVGSSDAGKYLIYLVARLRTSSASLLNDAQFRIKKNGSYTLGTSIWSFNSNPIREAQPGVVAILDLAATDYIEGFVYSEIASGTVAVEGAAGASASYFGGFKLI